MSASVILGTKQFLGHLSTCTLYHTSVVCVMEAVTSLAVSLLNHNDDDDNNNDEQGDSHTQSYVHSNTLSLLHFLGF